MTNSKAIFAIVGTMLFVVIATFVLMWSDFSTYRTHSVLQAKYAENISNRAAQQSPAILGTAITGVMTGLQYLPMIALVIIVTALAIVFYRSLVMERKKPRVAFIKGRDAKKLSPDAYAKKRNYERMQRGNLGHEVNSLDGELRDLARIAKVNALGGMADNRGAVPPPSRFGGNRFGAPDRFGNQSHKFGGMNPPGLGGSGLPPELFSEDDD